ncbi:MAG: hypothetical protein OHK0022_51980 [Roseiflexaceae bacterium]
MSTPDGWCPFALRLPSANYTPGNQGRRAVVIHVVEGSYDSATAWLRNPQSRASAHFVIAKDGRIAQLVSINDSAWGNGLGWRDSQWLNPRNRVVQPTWPDLTPGGNPNQYTISIEHEGLFHEPWTQAMYEANNRLLQWIAARYGLSYVAGRTLIGHAALDPLDRANCPGPTVDLARMAADANRGGGAAPVAVIGTDALILGPESGAQARVVEYVQRHLKPGSEYSGDVATIIGYYWTYAPPVGLDPFLAAAQCVFETDSLNSDWAARPRRNPAGLGVRQEGGLSFDTWEHGVQAHLGQLLALALRDDQASPAQRQLIAANPRHDHIPTELRGSVRTLADLNDRWTNDPDYGSKLAARANAILGLSASATLYPEDHERLVPPLLGDDEPAPISEAHLPDS